MARVVTQDRVMVHRAVESRLVGIELAHVRMFLHAIRQSELPADAPGCQHAIKIDPLAAVVLPGLATKRLADTGLLEGLLKFDEVLASHLGSGISELEGNGVQEFEGRLMRRHHDLREPARPEIRIPDRSPERGIEVLDNPVNPEL